jgi:hypothetical protein
MLSMEPRRDVPDTTERILRPKEESNTVSRGPGTWQRLLELAEQEEYVTRRGKTRSEESAIIVQRLPWPFGFLLPRAGFSTFCRRAGVFFTGAAP